MEQALMEQALALDLARCDRMNSKLQIIVVAAHNLERSATTYCEMKRARKTAKSPPIEESSTPAYNFEVTVNMQQDRTTPIQISIKEPVRLRSDKLLGTLTIYPEDFCRKLPSDGWYLLDGVSTGELWIKARLQLKLQDSPPAPDIPMCDMYGFTVPPSSYRYWKRYQSYRLCRQERAREAWSQYDECTDPASQIPADKLAELLLTFGPPTELRSVVLASCLAHGQKLKNVNQRSCPVCACRNPSAGMCFRRAPRGQREAREQEALSKCQRCHSKLRRVSLSPEQKYRNLVRLVYTEMETKAPEWELILEQIDKDLPRTFGDHQTIVSTEEGQDTLRQILLAVALDNHVVGYCQALNNIAGHLMCIPATKEHQVFWMMTSLVDMFGDWYDASMSGIRRDMLVIDEIVQKIFPSLTDKTKELGVPLSLILSGFLLCMYVEVLPAGSFFRLLDGMCYCVVAEDGAPFGLLLGVLLSAIRGCLTELMLAEDIDDFKATIQECLGAMINGDVMLKQARHELEQLGLETDLGALRAETGKNVALADAAQKREDELASRRLSVSVALDQAQLEALMAQVLRAGGVLSGGEITASQFSDIVLRTNPDFPVGAHRKVFDLFDTDHNEMLDFKEMTAACESLSGINNLGMLRVAFVVYASDPDLGLRFKEMMKFFSFLWGLMQEGMPSEERMSNLEMQSMCTHVFRRLKSAEQIESANAICNAALSFEEFSQFGREVPIIAHFLQMQCHRARNRWFAHQDENDSPSIFSKMFNSVF